MRVEWSIQDAYYALALRQQEVRKELQNLPEEHRDLRQHYLLGKLQALDEAKTIIHEKIESKIR